MKLQGALDSFTGIERIFENGADVYILHYHGGRIAPEADMPE